MGYQKIFYAPYSDKGHFYLDQSVVSTFSMLVGDTGTNLAYQFKRAKIIWSAKSGQSGQIENTNLTSATASVTAPAGTFPAETMITITMRLEEGDSGVTWISQVSHTESFFTVYPPESANPEPREGGFVNRREASRFSWEFRYSKAQIYPQRGYKQAKASFRYRAKGGSGFDELEVVGDENSVVVPENTFTSDEVEWMVLLTANDDTVGTAMDWITVTTVDKLSTAEPISPVSSTINRDADNLFEWSHRIETGSQPTKSELQYSLNGADWLALGQTGERRLSFLAAAGSLPSGALFWRVRTYNSSGRAGAWSDPAVFLSYGAPAKPIMTSPGSAPRVLLRWQSFDQQSYEARIGDWSSGVVYGVEKELLTPFFFPDGPYEASLRIQSALGLWSEWAKAPFSVLNRPVGSVSLAAVQEGNGMALSWSASQLFECFLVCRDETAIAKTNGLTFTDQFATGAHRYCVRGVMGNYYTQSNTVLASTRLEGGVISAVGRIDWIPLLVRRNHFPSHRLTAARKVNLFYFAGRKNPVAEVGDEATREHLIEYTVRNRESLEKLGLLVGETVIYKDACGDRVIGILTGISDKRDWAADAALTVIETDFREEVAL